MSVVKYVSRGGMKLSHALDQCHFDPNGLCCSDLGSHIGGFVDCLLQRGATRVYAVDTAYGTFAWKLRRDPRVILLERTNALHVELPEKVELITIDLGWTKQELILPHARTLLRPGGTILTLIKPHYEAKPHMLKDGVVIPEHYPALMEELTCRIVLWGFEVLCRCESPLRGHGGNREEFLHLKPLEIRT